MQARIILNSILVGTLLLSRAAFAGPATDERANDQHDAGVFNSSTAELIAMRERVQKHSDESRAEVIERIMLDSRQQLSMQIDAAKLLLDVAKAAQGYLEISISDMAGNVSLTAR